MRDMEDLIGGAGFEEVAREATMVNFYFLEGFESGFYQSGRGGSLLTSAADKKVIGVGPQH